MILITPKGSIDSNTKRKLTLKGYVLIESDEPERIRLVQPEAQIITNDYFMAALQALTEKHPTSKAHEFVNSLYQRLSASDSPESI